MSYWYLLLKFVIGGGIIVAVTLLANYINPKWGGIIAVAPITTTLSIIFVRMETNVITTQELVMASIVYVIPSILFLFAMYFLISRMNLVTSLSASFGVWLVAVLIMRVFY